MSTGGLKDALLRSIREVGRKKLDARQLEHMELIKALFCDRMEEKYIRGAIEHEDSVLHDMGIEALLENAIDEAVDQVVYLLTLREKLMECKSDAPKHG